MDDLSVIDRFTDTFSQYIDSGFGLLHGEIAYLSATLIAIDITLAGLFWAFGVVPHAWLTYSGSELAMRSDAILAGPGSTGLMQWSPIVISKQTLADLIAESAEEIHSIVAALES